METEKTPLYDLNPTEVRVLACLMEKELTTPDQYPLTENALKLACNQKTNRIPVMNLETGQVGRALLDLYDSDWVSADRGSRADRYSQRARSRLSMTKAQQSILCMILLRGPQTLAELKSRTERMVKSEADLLEALNIMTKGESPLVEKMERQAGQREERYRQWAFPQKFILAKDSAIASSMAPVDDSRIEALEEAVKQLEARIAALEGL